MGKDLVHEKHYFGHRARLALTPVQIGLMDAQGHAARATWNLQVPKIGRVRLRWTRDLPIGKRADNDNRITGARLVKDPLGWHIAFRIQTPSDFAPESASV